MTREQLAKEIYKRYFNNSTTIAFIETVILRLEEMGLIKFESEREAVIKDAQEYLKQDCIGPHTLIKRLLALLK